MLFMGFLLKEICARNCCPLQSNAHATLQNLRNINVYRAHADKKGDPAAWRQDERGQNSTGVNRN
jgi:hypothetical protein